MQQIQAPDEERKTDTLLYCHTLYEGVRKLEDAMSVSTPDGDWCKAYWQNMVWPHNNWNREILIGLAEGEFELSVPLPVNKELGGAARCQKTTRTVENFFNIWRARARKQASEAMTPQSGWNAIYHSKHMRDDDRGHVIPTTADKVHRVSSLPPTTFKARPQKFSLGGGVMADYMGEKFWSTPQAHKLFETAEALTHINFMNCLENPPTNFKLLMATHQLTSSPTHLPTHLSIPSNTGNLQLA